MGGFPGGYGFPGITVEVGYAGTGGESSSFKHEFFDRTINVCRDGTFQWRCSQSLRQLET
jgi:hypothetical protein